MTQPWAPAAIVRPLPHRVMPMLNETVESYIRRLAEANIWYSGDLREYIRFGADTAAFPPDRLAAISGIPLPTLRLAMLELCGPEDLTHLRVTGRPRPGIRQRPGCRRCTHGQSASFWTRHEEEIVCLRHRTLTGAKPFDLTMVPEVLTANHRHRRLIRRHGREPVRHAFQAASSIVRRWEDNRYLGESHRRIEVLQGNRWKAGTHDPVFIAAFYPEAVALTRLLVTPYWRSLILGGHQPRPTNTDLFSELLDLDWSALFIDRHYLVVTQSPAIDAFLTEIKRVTGHDIRWNPIPSNRVYAPLAEWVIDELDERHGLSHPIVGQPPPAAETLG